MNLFCAGISHQTAPLEMREQLLLSSGRIREVIAALRTNGYSECVVFSSRDRTEIYIFGEVKPPGDKLVLNILLPQEGEIPSKNIFVAEGQAAVEHLLRVSTGLESMIVGDVGLLQLVKEGFFISRDCGAAGPSATRLFESAFEVFRRVQAETSISEGAVSVSHASVELAERIYDDLALKKALIVGTGETAHMTARQLIAHGIGSLSITHPNAQRSDQLASNLSATALPFDAFHDQISLFDIVIFSLSSQSHILTSKDMRQLGKSRHGRTLFLIDCGVPHNVDPFVGEQENVFLYDLDALNLMVSENIARRRLQIPAVESMIRGELKTLGSWFSSPAAPRAAEQ